jgi:hypothetical protein
MRQQWFEDGRLVTERARQPMAWTRRSRPYVCLREIEFWRGMLVQVGLIWVAFPSRGVCSLECSANRV